MAKNTFVINYTKRKLTITFNYENLIFDLDEGDTGDFWGGFTTVDGRHWDLSFFQEDDTCEPTVEVYPAVWEGDENGSYEIDTNNGILLACIAKEGDAEEYFKWSIVTKPIEVGDTIGGRFKVLDILPPIADKVTSQNMREVKEKLQAIIASINECGMGAWNADLENTVEAVALEDYYGDVESDEPTVKYNGWYEELEKLLESL